MWTRHRHYKKKQIGLGYDNIAAQMNANQSYTPSIDDVINYNKKIMNSLDIPSLCGGGIGSNIQLHSTSANMITPTNLLNYTFDIMNGLSSKEPPLEWTTNYKNGNEMAAALKLKSLTYDLNIQKKLQQNGGSIDTYTCSIDKNKLIIFIHTIVYKNDKNKLTISDINNIYLTLNIITPIIYNLI